MSGEQGGARGQEGTRGVQSQHPRCPRRWVAYEGTNFSGEQYILEKGVYRSCEDWGATDCRIASVQPILQVRAGPTGATGLVGARLEIRPQPAPFGLLPGWGTQPPFRLQGRKWQMGRGTCPPRGIIPDGVVTTLCPPHQAPLLPFLRSCSSLSLTS